MNESQNTGYRPDFIERNGTWVLSVIASVLTFSTAIFTYCLKSRCTKISCCCISCERQVVKLNSNLEVVSDDNLKQSSNV